jgi:hypothetical protein
VNNAQISKRSSGEKGQSVAPAPPRTNLVPRLFPLSEARSGKSLGTRLPPHCFGNGGNCPRGSGAPAFIISNQIA